MAGIRAFPRESLAKAIAIRNDDPNVCEQHLALLGWPLTILAPPPQNGARRVRKLMPRPVGIFCIHIQSAPSAIKCKHQNISIYISVGQGKKKPGQWQEHKAFITMCDWNPTGQHPSVA